MKRLLVFILCTINTLFCASPALAPQAEYVLACDVGKAEINTGLFAVMNGKPVLKEEYKAVTSEVKDFTGYAASLIARIKQQQGIAVHKACFAVPGYTNDQKNFIQAPHLPWAVDGKAIGQATGIARPLVVNDFECVGFGVQAIDQKDSIVLHQGKPREHGTRAIVGAGAGLGSGLMLWDAQIANYMPSPLSYSFVDFCPYSEFELKFSCYLQETAGSHSWGKVLGSSGGIVSLYDFLNQCKPCKAAPKKFQNYLELFEQRSHDERCKEAVALYMQWYARLVRTVAYAQLPHNGVYIVNTVAQSFPELFTHPSFMQEYFKTDNQYLQDYLKEIPVYLVTHPKLQLYGAAFYALVYAK